jgi:hypothetical protein
MLKSDPHNHKCLSIEIRQMLVNQKLKQLQEINCFSHNQAHSLYEEDE